MSVEKEIQRLLMFALAKGLLSPEDEPFAKNALLYALGMDALAEGVARDGEPLPQTVAPMLETLTDEAAARGLIPDEPFHRERFASHLMNLLTPPPSFIFAEFARRYAAQGPEAATDWFYGLCRASDYIRVDQIARNTVFSSPSPYGDLEITINLSKPEKDPREIAREKALPQMGYPRCMLCVENEGYAGRPGYPSHETLRTVKITLGAEAWRLQYSPYLYYPEHCIALNEQHIPMSITRRTFDLLLDFTRQFPHYFIGSNADLPIVGGSILSHDHFQGGRHVFPMDKAPAYAAFQHPAYPGIMLEAVRWPMTCLRLVGRDTDALAGLADALLCAWRGYDDAGLDVLHETDGTPHNTVTPIARRLPDGQTLLHLVLRNNRTTPVHPLGVFHPHADLHHIKKENIGLIEVMGLFILPGRLDAELAALSEYLTGERPLECPDEQNALSKHYAWIQALCLEHGTALTQECADSVLRNALGAKCVSVLEDAGVYKPTPEGDTGLERFLRTIGMERV